METATLSQLVYAQQSPHNSFRNKGLGSTYTCYSNFNSDTVGYFRVVCFLFPLPKQIFSPDKMETNFK